MLFVVDQHSVVLDFGPVVDWPLVVLVVGPVELGALAEVVVLVPVDLVVVAVLLPGWVPHFLPLL